jgi:hypothetical protein
MSGFLGQRLTNSRGFPRLYKAAQILLYWSFWTTFTLSPGCIVPVAPEFQDPPKAPNYYPYFVESLPLFDTTTGVPQTFEVHAGDPNPADILYVRWASDYPPFTQARSRVIDQSMVRQDLPQTEIIYKAIDPMPCEKFAPGMEHKLVVIVSDRPFVPTGVFSTRPDRFNAVEGDATIPIMRGWIVQGCPP